MELRVSATRQELTRLKNRHRMAQRGHRLLKDKRDQLVKEFMKVVYENQRLREELEERLSSAYASVSHARALLSPPVLESALLAGATPGEVKLSYRRIMNVVVPEMELVGADAYAGPEGDAQGSSKGAASAGADAVTADAATHVAIIPAYGLAATSSDLDDALGRFRGILPLLVKLSQVERTIGLLADEIERTRRRVNALEYVVIPELEETVKSIHMRLEEMDRASTSRLMKVKDIVRAR